jgi:hypothetical protein
VPVVRRGGDEIETTPWVVRWVEHSKPPRKKLWNSARGGAADRGGRTAMVVSSMIELT